MSRKGVGRGRRYTVRVNRDGSQQYKRRGCGDSIIMGLVLIVGLTYGIAQLIGSIMM